MGSFIMDKQCNTSAKIQTINNNEDMGKITDINWYHGELSRHSAEILLMANAEEGMYLLRNNSNQDHYYSVSVRCHSSIKHYALYHDTNRNIFVFGIATFNSLPELLEHFQSYPILNNDQDQTVVLKAPYLKSVECCDTYAEVTRQTVLGNNFFFGKIPDVDYLGGSKEGYLLKRGVIRKSWKERWFVLQKNHLMYYCNKMSPKPIRTLDLGEAIYAREGSCENRPNCFRIDFPKRTFYIVADSRCLVREWLDILTSKIEHYKKPSTFYVPVPRSCDISEQTSF